MGGEAAGGAGREAGGAGEEVTEPPPAAFGKKEALTRTPTLTPSLTLTPIPSLILTLTLSYP